MPITPAFTIAQSATSPNLVTATDTSAGSDVLITQRRIYFETSQGTFLVQSGTTTDYEEWDIIDSTIELDLLLVDYSVNCTVEWLDAGNSVLYTLSQEFCLAEYNKQFAVYLGQLLAITPSILQDTNYMTNLCNFWAYITYAENMILLAADISNSQNLLNKATQMRQNQQLYF